MGMRPVAEIMYIDFLGLAMDQLVNQAAKWHYMSGGQTTVPLVVRSSVGAGKGYGGQHSQALEAHATHTPGLYVVYPSTPEDAKGLLKSAIRDDNPVIFMEAELLYGTKGEVPEGEYTIPIGMADIKRQGTDVTIVAWSKMVTVALAPFCFWRRMLAMGLPTMFERPKTTTSAPSVFTPERMRSCWIPAGVTRPMIAASIAISPPGCSG